MTPVLSRVPTKLGDSIRLLLDQHFPSLPGRTGMTGLELALLLQSEGQTPPTPSVGGTIAEDAQKSGRPVAYMLSQQEYVAGYHAPDLTALDQSIGVGSIDYLMSLRGTRGPIGKYQEDLYVARRVGDLARLGDEMRAHGIPSVTDFAGLPLKQLQTTIAAKALKAVQTAAGPLFLMLPVGTLMGNEGVLARAASFEVPIKAIA